MDMYRPRFQISPELLRFLIQATELKAWITQAVIDVPWLPTLQRETAARLEHEIERHSAAGSSSVSG